MEAMVTRNWAIQYGEEEYKRGKREGHRKAQDKIWDKIMGAKKSGYDEGKQDSGKEVVEWLEEQGEAKTDYTDDGHILRSYLEIPRGLLQAQKKVWGIK